MSKLPPSPVVSLSALRCDCGSDDLAAVAPGSEPVVVAGIVLDPGQPVRAWCRACWMPARATA